MRAKLYGIGVGPGDPELLTLKAVRAMQQADVIAVPETGSGEQIALGIYEKQFGHTSKRIVHCPTPMTKDPLTLKAGYEQTAQLLCDILEGGEIVAFLTIGDPCIYSTYLYIHELVSKQGYETEIIPGIPSFCAAAAALNVSLCERAEPLHILPASYGIEQALELPGTKVFMKSGMHITKTLEYLAKTNQLTNSMLVERIGLKGERLVSEITAETKSSGYLTLIITKENKA